MAFYDQPRAWYFHDLWKRTLSTWGATQGWSRVELSRPGPTFDYPDMAAGQTQSNLTILGAHGQSGLARRWRWTGSAWLLEAQRATGDTGALDPPMVSQRGPFSMGGFGGGVVMNPGNASPSGAPTKDALDEKMDLDVPLALAAVATVLWWKFLT